ncbi:glutaredoxin domain-containing protein [Clostridium gasigenes]|uniref:Glutaredoxin-like protein, YruB-family n=1 Tax=Clostridium gasigenes TaxID=94869 RepID=A0A1H0SGF6_9CLOT|nr:glutaredoxin domain-containing protein [Clostridium gasigenes]MBB6625033.1 glutathione S-transferase N-terminal domain-containing protein [Clostridium gasigenes]MBU3088944.1 glutathione S-transferase N-terminal domain-containing protein [Clostridium gasigenes]MBU3104898.1 glutathione S-transferase N-terminal domain-containing protein [Clostridium gasigenes]MBU3108690.1 glutathione S-transferase N-terminal domain-containing protein [Clostridium gasigenes]MBU3133439.1 glutathione S-transferas
MVKVYTTNSCPWCVKVKNYLKGKEVLFEELNVQDNMDAREEMVSKSKQMGVPVLDINGAIIIGFDKKAIETALEK